MDNIYLKHLIEKIKLKECEYNTIKSVLEQYNGVIQETLNNIFLDTNITPEEIFTNCIYQEKETIIKEHDEFYDTLYRNLALKTHPDKTENNNNDFVKIKEAYENKDVLTLIYYGDKYKLLDHNNINTNLFIMILEKRLYEMKNKIKTIKNGIHYRILIGNKNEMISIIKETIKYKQETMELKQKNEKLKKEIYNNT
ncbi:DnaJ chaperone protein [Fadolivirus algeromassiliense]|jgi:hypothetical protein|uniref:DnaJ chaperone protein n=1 Tax=Fadolivirus FV1/VV64 TaxID=3070911 RepID=A0A7D3QUQ7_9VIRU|nr:DnaJ chaperone protein [Fadolivirus algeromassiliense]QKF93764.1 DnaJ chaperone protein [Fadolivirus FV1/VV64]